MTDTCKAPFAKDGQHYWRKIKSIGSIASLEVCTYCSAVRVAPLAETAGPVKRVSREVTINQPGPDLAKRDLTLPSGNRRSTETRSEHRARLVREGRRQLTQAEEDELFKA